jgi:hypothetical protein
VQPARGELPQQADASGSGPATGDDHRQHREHSTTVVALTEHAGLTTKWDLLGPAEPPQSTPAVHVRPRSARVESSQPRRTGTRVLLIAAATVLACAGALGRLWPEIREQTPSAYALAALLGGTLLLLYRAQPRRHEPDIHDRQVDYLVGLPLLGVAAFVLTAMPARFGERFWAAHADLLIVPVVIAGATALVFGTRALWRVRLPLAALTAALVPLSDAPASGLATSALGPATWLVAHLPTGSAIAPVAYTGALTGAAGCLAFVALATFLALSAADWTAAAARVAALLGAWIVVTVLRLGLALALASALRAEASHAVLGATGDLVVLAMLLTIAGLLTWGASRREAVSAGPRGRSTPVGRARIALVIVGFAAALLALLDTSTATRTGIEANTAAARTSPFA